MGKIVVAIASLACSVTMVGCGGGSQSRTPQVKSLAQPTHPADRAHGRGGAVAVVRVSTTAYGRALVDRRGFALYLFTHDRSSASTCYTACAGAWPPYVVAKRRQGAGPDTREGLLGTVRRADGRLQVTYAGHPLYHYVDDRQPGQVLCQAVTQFGGTWLVVAPNGQAIR